MNKPYDRPLRGKHCQCRGCFEYFNSETAFNQHRTGSYGPPIQRRCLTVDEMLEYGMSLNPAGFWVSETRLQRAARAVAASKGAAERQNG